MLSQESVCPLERRSHALYGSDESRGLESELQALGDTANHGVAIDSILGGHRLIVQALLCAAPPSASAADFASDPSPLRRTTPLPRSSNWPADCYNPFFAVYIPMPDVNSNFNALNMRLTHVFAQGLYAQFYYRYGKSIDENSYTGPGFVTNQTYPQDLKSERGPSDFDVTITLLLRLSTSCPS